MFDFFKKNADLNFRIDTSKVSIGGEIQLIVYIIPKKDFISQSLQIRLNWQQCYFDNETPFIRDLQGNYEYRAGGVIELPFVIPFITYDELNAWYRENGEWDNIHGESMTDADENYQAFLQEVQNLWIMEIYLSIPGFDISSKQILQIIPTNTNNS